MRFPFGAVVFAGALACGETNLEPLPLDITVAPSRTTAAPGDTVVFVVTAQGGTLIGVETDYGDGKTDVYGTSGARTAKVTFRHAYGARGTFSMSAKITDGQAGQKTARVEIKVN